jgi:SAM-dependent methyltransferase
MPVFMDFPVTEIDGLDAVIAGWVAGADRDIPIRVTAGGEVVPHFMLDRPDVRVAFAQLAFTTGIGAPINVLNLAGTEFPVTIEYGDEEVSRKIGFTPQAREKREIEARLRQEAKIWCENHMCCPHCKNGLIASGDQRQHFLCTRCDRIYPQTMDALDFLPPSLRFALAPQPATTSANPYDPAALALIDETTRKGGVVLDCGAGFRSSRLPNVINLEISNYRSTDMLAAGEALPFKDASFDAILSLAVLEHVRDPFACAREMLRVVKPGGQIMCSVPFLQPEHNFPGHFYNMTQTGLRNLFGDAAELVSAEVPPHGHPIFAVQWILRDYLAGLPEHVKGEFSAMTIGQAAALEPARFLTSQAAIRLSPEAAQTIACLNTLVFRRPK